MESAEYSRSGRTLRITGCLDLRVDVRFDIEVRALLDEAACSECPSVVIDFRGVTALRSQYLTSLAAICDELKKRNGTLTICVDKAMANLMKSCGVDRVARLEMH